MILFPPNGRRAIEIIAENKIREAQDLGKFDNLPGRGQPLANLGEGNDPDWALKRLIIREALGQADKPKRDR